MDTMDSLQIGRKTVESILWYTIAPILLQIVRFGSTVILARILSPHDFGIIGIASAITFYCNNLSTFGLGNAIVQKKEITIDHVHTFFTINIFISIILCFVFVSFAENISNFFEIKELADVIKGYSLIFILTSFYTIGYTKLRRNLEFKQLSMNEITKTFFSVATSLTLALAGYQYWSLLIGSLVSVSIATVSINFRARILPRILFRKQAFVELYNFACWNFFSQQIRLVSEYLDKLIIGKFLGATPLGFYEKSFSIACMPNEQIANKIGVVAFSTFSRSQGDMEEIRYYFIRIFTITTFAVFPIYFGLFAVSDSFVLVLLGQKWEAMIPSFKILLVAFFVSSLSSIFSTANIACGNHKGDTKIRLACLTVSAPCVGLVAKNGIELVAVVIFLHNFLFLFCSTYLVKSKLSLSTQTIIKIIFPALTGAGLMLIIILIAHKLFFVNPNAIYLLLEIIFGTMIYGIWFLCTKFKEWHFMKLKFFSILSRLNNIV